MRIKTGFEIIYECPVASPMLLMLNVHPSRVKDLETPDTLQVDRDADVHQYRDGFGNICTRVLAPAGRTVFSTDFVVRDSGEPDAPLPEGVWDRVEDLPDDAIVYLLGSRYCETDRMADLAWAQFGHIPPGAERVRAIVEYAHRQIGFGYQHARATKTAWEAHEERFGVCRDYAHLAVTLCRCMNIPARYCTGYLGDIGVAPVPGPMDFSAWFEVYLGGAWHTQDARHNRARVGRVLMGRGRDATDVAIVTSFGGATLVGFTVVSDEIAEAA